MTARLERVQPVLLSTNLHASRGFFERLGFETTFLDDPAAPRYAEVARDEVSLFLQWHDTAGPAGSDRPTYRFLVRQVDALFREFQAAGAVVIPSSSPSPWARPADTPWGTREFHLRDPDGNGLQFYYPL